MMKQSLKSLLALAFVAVIFAVQPAQTNAQSGKQVWAFYMGFWMGGGSWDGNPYLTDYPAIGAYDSRDGGVAGTHIDQARSAGINAFMVSWYGIDNGETTAVLNNMLDRAAERDFKIGAVIDIFGGFNQDHLMRSLQHLVNDRIHHPAYLRYNGRPVIMFAFQGNAGLSATDWQNIRNAVDPNRSTIWIAEGLSGCCLYGGAMDGQYAFNIAWSNGSAARYTQERNAVINRGGSLYVATVHPGWDETRVAAGTGRTNPTSPRDRAGGQFLTNSWNGAIASGTDVVMVVSWNEFMENSHIEPSVNYGSQSLDVLRPLIAAWQAGSPAPVPEQPAPDAPSAPTGQVAEATVNLNVRAGAGTGFNVLGRINPGTTYAVIGQEGDWVVIDYNGQRGYVASSFVTVSGGTPSAPPAPEQPAPDAPSAPSGQVAESTVNLNVRAGAGTGFNVLGRINPGTTYAVIGQEGDWVVIDYNGQRGYVASSFVTVSGGTPSAGGGGVIEGPSAVSSVTVNVRTGAGTQYRALGQIRAGVAYAVVGEEAGWVIINYNGQNGYVLGQLVTVRP
jgi:uncharacterized protein YgiM (DUF1202 family)